MKATRFFPVTIFFLGISLSAFQIVSGQNDRLKQAMDYRPFQDGVTYERSEGENLEGLTFGNAESIGQVGFLIRDENNLILRRYVDTDNDKRLDTWAYYLRGVEVYRDVDTNQDTKPDTFMWLGPEGSRIGLDKDQDRVIESWEKISPQEVTIEVVEALRKRDEKRLRCMFLKPEEIAGLKLDKDVSERVEKRLKASLDDFASKIKSVEMEEDASWLHFGAPFPGAITGSEGNVIDVFDNVSALFEAKGENKQLAIGSMILVGKAWKLIDFPNIPGGESAQPVGGVFFQSGAASMAVAAAAGDGNGVSAEILNAYQKAEDDFRKSYGSVQGKELADLHQKRAIALMKVAIESKNDRENWVKQYADIVSAAYQSGEFPDGLKELEAQIPAMVKNEFGEELVAYSKYRMLNAWYSRAAEDAEDLDEIQEKWQDRLNGFITEYPKSNLAAEALFELAKIDDYIGDIESAEKVYRRIVANFPKSPLAARAKGAVVRLTCEGKVIDLQGDTVNGKAFSLNQTKGKMTLVHYWATWCEPCKSEFGDMKELYAKYQKKGFEIVSISLDESRDDVMNYLKKNQDLPWIQLYADGGLEESPLAAQLGIIALPTMLLIDTDGKVLERGTTLQQVERELRKMK